MKSTNVLLPGAGHDGHDADIAPGSLQIHGFSRSCVSRIINAIADSDSDGISRAEIADQAGVTVMTVGKAVDMLLASGLVCEHKSERHMAGRRAGILSLCRDNYFIVLDVSERTFRMDVVDASATLSDTSEYNCIRDFTLRDNLTLFFKNVRSAIECRADKDKLCGIGLVVADADGDVELETVNPRELAESIIACDVDVVMRGVDAALLSLVRRGNHSLCDRVVVYVSIGDSLGCAVCDRGHIFRGAHGHGCELSHIRLRLGETLGERVARCRSDSEVSAELAPALGNMIALFDPDTIVIESTRLLEPAMTVDDIKRRIEREFHIPTARMPEFIVADGELRLSTRGVAHELRRSWLDSLISG